MIKIFSLIVLVVLCFTLVRCDNNDANNNGSEVLTPFEEIIKKISGTQKIVIRDAENNTESVIKTLVDNKEIEEIINIVSRGSVMRGPVPSDLYTWLFFMYDRDDNIIYTMQVWRRGQIAFEGYEEEYFLGINKDLNTLIRIIER